MDAGFGVGDGLVTMAMVFRPVFSLGSDHWKVVVELGSQTSIEWLSGIVHGRGMLWWAVKVVMAAVSKPRRRREKKRMGPEAVHSLNEGAVLRRKKTKSRRSGDGRISQGKKKKSCYGT